MTVAYLTLFLIIRTFLTIYLAEVNGKIVKSMIEIKFGSFVKNIMKLVIFAIPGSFINSFLEFIRKRLTI